MLRVCAHLVTVELLVESQMLDGPDLKIALTVALFRNENFAKRSYVQHQYSMGRNQADRRRASADQRNAEESRGSANPAASVEDHFLRR